MTQRARAIRFGTFEVDIEAGELRRNGMKVRVQDQPFQVLTALLERPGDVVTRECLQQRLWAGDTFVEFDRSLNTAVNKLREALGDVAENPRYVETIPRKGYRFIAPVKIINPLYAVDEPPGIAPERERSGMRAGVGGHRFWPWIASMVLLVTCVALVWSIWRREPRAGGGVQKFTIAPEGGADSPVISPAGTHIAYCSGRAARIWIQALDQFEPQQIAGSDGSELPFWSPDSRHIAFAAGGRLWRAPLAGGQPATICLLPGHYLGGAWHPSGDSILFSVDRKGFYEVSAKGGTPSLVLEVDQDRWGEHIEMPSYLPPPHTDFLLYTAQTRDRTHVTVLRSLKSGRDEIIAPNGAGAYSPSGHVLYWREGLLWAVPISAVSMKATGSPFPVGTNPLVQPSVSLDGTLVYATKGEGRLVVLDRSGARLQTVWDPIPYTGGLSLSPDGTRIVIGTFDGRTREIWLADLRRGTRTRFTSGEGLEGHPVWHPSGASIAFRSKRLGDWNILVKPADGSGDAAPIATSPVDGMPEDWSPDGNTLLYRAFDPQRRGDLWYLEKNQSGAYEPAPFLQTPGPETQGRFSPDGQFVAYVSDESGRSEIYVTPFPKGGGRYRVSLSGGVMPRWRRDGKELFYIASDGSLMVAPVETRPQFSTGRPKALFVVSGLGSEAGVGQRFDVSADGNRLLVPESSDAAAKIRVVRNWFAEFRDRREN
ncbi:MAG: PD40 domain-containing protein [Bryobacteraceae bacterium]|nr:PD40 domain-containing protein [Bryobacteraceae bacterium]